MKKSHNRLYLDTSVIGGCLDEEFAEDSNRLLDAVRSGHFIMVLSQVVTDELARAPTAVQAILAAIPEGVMEPVPLTEEIFALRDCYLDANIVGRRSLNDATHVAAATVARADAIVSWNFKHIVRYDRIKGFNRVNLDMGYGLLTIVSPKEIVTDEDEP